MPRLSATRALWSPDPGVVSAALLAELVAEPFVITGQISYGLGTMLIRPDPDGPVEYAHNGALNGYVSWAGFRPDLDVGLALMANGWPDDGAGGLDYGYSSHLAQDLWGIVEEHLAP